LAGISDISLVTGYSRSYDRKEYQPVFTGIHIIWLNLFFPVNSGRIFLKFI
jgi:hypothetical protein